MLGLNVCFVCVFFGVESEMWMFVELCMGVGLECKCCALGLTLIVELIVIFECEFRSLPFFSRGGSAFFVEFGF